MNISNEDQKREVNGRIYEDGSGLVEDDNVNDINGNDDNKGKGTEVYGLYLQVKGVVVINHLDKVDILKLILETNG